MGALPMLGVVNRRNVTHFIHKVTTTTSGAVGSQDAPGVSGVVATKTATKTGRYTLALGSKFRVFLGGFVSLIGADDTAYTTQKGFGSFFRDNDIDGGAADGTVEVQFTRTDTEADTELEDGAVAIFHIFVEQ